MIAVALSLALAQAPIESYEGLSRVQLLEQRRLVKENFPRRAGPVLLICGATLPVIAMGTLFGLAPQSGSSEVGMFVGGGIATAVMLAMVIGGFVWLAAVIGVQDSAEARLEELEALLK